MNVEYYIGSKKVSWNTMTLEEYLSLTYIPRGWKEGFEATNDIISEISGKLKQYTTQNTIYPPLTFVFNSFD